MPFLCKTCFSFQIEIPPDDRVADNARRNGNQSARAPGANNTSGPSLQKICTRIQKETCKFALVNFIRMIFFDFFFSDQYHVLL